jgi:hypothetical protein
VPLKATAAAPDLGDGFHPARDADGLRELERALSLLAAREHRWELYERLAGRASLDLAPPELWLLARLGERRPLDADEGRIAETLEQLRERALVETRDDGTTTLTAAGREDYERLVTARCAGLRELLDGWEPDQHRELEHLVDRLARDLVSEMPAPAPGKP